MFSDAPRFREATNPLESERTRGHRHVGALAPHPRERHWVLAAAVTVAVLSAAASAYAAYEQGQQQMKIAKFNKDVAENTATAQRNAAAIEAENKRDQYRLIMASQRAGIGASGVLGSEGTPLVVQTDSAEKAALNEARIRYSGEVGARAAESEAIIQGYMGKSAARQGTIQAGVNLLQGASSAAGGYARYNSGGGGGTGRSESAYQSYRRGERATY